jgi:histidyl-tRNA synthetase
MSSNNNTRLNDISGFPELSMYEQIVLERVKRGCVDVYELFGFGPLETRLVEDKKILEEKGIEGKELFTLNSLHRGEVKEKGDNEQVLALRFDLTVPFARYVGQYYKTLPFPLKRWQIQKVYRGETARESLGRFCEFYQSDIDVIGKGELSIIYDAEFPCVIYKIFREVIGIERFVIRISNRRLLEGLFLEFGMDDAPKLKKAVKVIDNMEKVPIEDTTAGLVALELSIENAEKILQFFTLCRNSRPSDVVTAYGTLKVKNALFKQGLDELAEVIRAVVANGVPEEYFMVDPSIARGLDYYTGTVYETSLLDFKHLGSVCSGGRFDDLVGTLSGDKTIKFPGCGLSIGLSRLVPTLIRNGVLRAESMSSAPVLIAVQDKKYMNQYNTIAGILRQAGIATSVNYNGGRLKAQIEFAAKYGFKFLLIGREELDTGKIQVKEMNSGKENDIVDISTLVEFISSRLTTTFDYRTQSSLNDREFLKLSVEEISAQLQACF